MKDKKDEEISIVVFLGFIVMVFFPAICFMIFFPELKAWTIFVIVIDIFISVFVINTLRIV